MRVATEQFLKSCGCRSAGECGHNALAETDALDHLISLMSEALRKKLLRKMAEGKSGWDAKDWPLEDLKRQLIEHVYKPSQDPLDVIAFALFWWNRNGETSKPAVPPADREQMRRETLEEIISVIFDKGVNFGVEYIRAELRRLATDRD